MAKFAKVGEGRYILDVSGYTCPYPVIYTRKALAKLSAGEILEVLTDNPPSCENVPRAVKEDGHDVLSVENVGRGIWRITIVKR
jgi:tRNA 2-thiouridine synthesizing protein A